ncbi:Hypothetical predicted protein [Marmota monax]|uniref:Uncharacterized protein n=1 Tax=Marmota monax TaxID=9995 RepID=A0A5E4AHX5_MARMO|nr:hypothetical protein GHT09_000812 [Marmota monax]VTJ56062.1 Hypothetical predicted protein [Marmota monax]
MEEGVPPSLPQITFATGSQPVRPKSAGNKRLGTRELGSAVPLSRSPPAGPEAVYPALPGHLPLVEAELRPRCNAETKCSQPGVAAGRSPWLGVWGGTRGAEEDCQGRGVMRRGGTLHPPRPRAPAATHQAPPFLPSEGQVFHTDSRDFKDQAIGETQSLPRKGGNLWKRGERQQTLPWDHQSLRCCGKPKAPSRRSRKEPQPQVEAVF